MLVTVPQVNPNDEITNDSVNQGPNALAAAVNGHLDDSNIEQLSGTKISAGTTPASVMNDSGNVEKRFDEAFADYVIDGCVWSALSGLNGSMTTGHISVQGKRLTAPAIATHAFTASKDTYVYLDASGLPVYTGEVANGAAAPVQPANTVQTYKIVTSASAIVSVTDVTSKPVTSDKINLATFQYSATEQIIGMWIDGNVLYRKVLSAGALPNNTTKDIPYNITNLGQFTNIYGAAVVTGASAEVRPIPFYNPASTAGAIGISAIVSSGVLRLYTIANLSGFNGYIVIEYTKTA